MNFVIDKNNNNNIIAFSEDVNTLSHLKNFDNLLFVENDMTLNYAKSHILAFIDNKIVSISEIINADYVGNVPESQKSDIEILQEENILLKERILQLEVAEVNRKSIEIEQQILGGTV